MQECFHKTRNKLTYLNTDVIVIGWWWVICIKLTYSKTSLDRPFAGVKSCGPFRKVVDLQGFPKCTKDTVLSILVVRRNWSIYRTAGWSVEVVGMGGSTVHATHTEQLLLGELLSNALA